MTARILPFPAHRAPSIKPQSWQPFNVEVLRESLGGWLVICRDHGWLHGSRREALADAREIAAGWDVGIVVRFSRLASTSPRSCPTLQKRFGVSPIRTSQRKTNSALVRTALAASISRKAPGTTGNARKAAAFSISSSAKVMAL